MRGPSSLSSTIKQIHQDYNIREKNIYAKLQDLKKSSTVTLNAMDSVCNFYEKTKNLIRWEEARMTQYFALVSFLMFLVVTFLPIRILFMIYLTRRFYRGQFYHKKRIRNNREVLLIEYRNFIEEHKSLLPKAASQGVHMLTREHSLDDKAPYLYEKWETVLAGKQMTAKVFEQKLIAHF